MISRDLGPPWLQHSLLLWNDRGISPLLFLPAPLLIGFLESTPPRISAFPLFLFLFCLRASKMSLMSLFEDLLFLYFTGLTPLTSLPVITNTLPGPCLHPGSLAGVLSLYIHCLLTQVLLEMCHTIAYNTVKPDCGTFDSSYLHIPSKQVLFLQLKGSILYFFKPLAFLIWIVARVSLDLSCHLSLNWFFHTAIKVIFIWCINKSSFKTDGDRLKSLTIEPCLALHTVLKLCSVTWRPVWVCFPTL